MKKNPLATAIAALDSMVVSCREQKIWGKPSKIIPFTEPECKHEWDGQQYDYATKQPKADAFKDLCFWAKCIKCGEFCR